MEPKSTLQIFIQVFKQIILCEKKTLKTCQERPDLLGGHFIKMFYKTTSIAWSKEWSSYTGLTELSFWLSKSLFFDEKCHF